MNEYYLGYALGMLVGLLLISVVIIVILKFTKRDHALRCKFDERQLQKRGTAFKLGFFTLLVENAIYACLSPLFVQDGPLESLPHFEDGSGSIFLQICIAVGVFAGYSIWNDCYFSLNESRSRLKLLFAVTGILNLVIFFCRLVNGQLLEDGMLTIYWDNLFCGLMFLFIFLMMFLRRLRPEEAED